MNSNGSDPKATQAILNMMRQAENSANEAKHIRSLALDGAAGGCSFDLLEAVSRTPYLLDAVLLRCEETQNTPGGWRVRKVIVWGKDITCVLQCGNRWDEERYVLVDREDPKRVIRFSDDWGELGPSPEIVLLICEHLAEHHQIP